MTSKRVWALATIGAFALAATACRDDNPVTPPINGVDGGVPDGGGVDPSDAGPSTMACNNPPLTAPASGTCAVTAGDGNKLIRGSIVTPTGLLENGHLLIGNNGAITCAACDCSSAPGFASATVVECANGVVSPGLINAHDHLTFTEAAPKPHGDEVYEHRHDWRRGKNGHTEIPSTRNQAGSEGVSWGELRNIMAGTTSINGSGGANGLTRNLDRSGTQQGLGLPAVDYSTFPLGDSNGVTRDMGCDYPNFDTLGEIGNASAYTPHVAEGIDSSARNEFVCLASPTSGLDSVVYEKAAIVHAIGLLAADYVLMAAERASLVWSPRSNIDLYGHTAQVTIADRAGVRLAMGTDWAISGSMNMLRELRCADGLNRNNYGRHFSDRALVDMATSSGAGALGVSDRVGLLKPGLEADVAIFNSVTNKQYRAIIDADPEDVILVMRGGEPLYGDRSVMDALQSSNTGCEPVVVCGVDKLACVQRDTGHTIADLRAAIAMDAYDLFFCAQPPNEPNCVPFRPGEFTGMPVSGDMDGDGIADDRDNCPTVFNAPRPLDGTMQADGDMDGDGDVCDVCPVDPNTSNCGRPDPNDRDGDMHPDGMDNCPGVPNMDQSDRDRDMIGDVCDQCPDEFNPGGAACSATVYAIKQGMVMDRVKVSDVIVTAVAGNGYFAQIDPASMTYDQALGPKHSGIFVFTGPMADKPTVGDSIEIDGVVSDFFGQTQLSDSTFALLASGRQLPPFVAGTPAELATGGAREAELEGALVEVGRVEVTDDDPEPGAGDSRPTNEYIVDGALRVNDLFHVTTPLPSNGQKIGFIRGILRHANGHSKLEPRDAGDLGLKPQLAGFNADMVFAPANATGATMPALEVLLTQTATMPITIDLSSSNAVITVDPTVTIGAGAQSAPITVTAGAVSATPAVITAMYDGETRTATVVVFDDNQPRQVTLHLDSTMLVPSSSVGGSLQLDLPGNVGGTSVLLSVSPPQLATVPAMVGVAEGALVGAFTMQSGTSTGAGTLTASVDGSMTSVAFSVSRSVSRSLVPGDLIITEVHRNPTEGGEKVREWIEIHNPTTDTLELDGLLIYDNRGAGAGHRLETTGAMLAPGGYAVLAYSDDPMTNGGVVGVAAAYGDADIQLANGDDEIHLSFDGDEIDSVDWATGWPGGNGVTMCLKFPYGDNSVQANWSDSVGAFGDGNAGSPGVASDATNCP